MKILRNINLTKSKLFLEKSKQILTNFWGKVGINVTETLRQILKKIFGNFKQKIFGFKIKFLDSFRKFF